MISWSAEFMERMGGSLPRDYFTFDTETTGFNREKDLIVEWGHTIVRDGVPVNELNLVINWFEGDLVPHKYVVDQLAKVRRNMALNGKQFRITPQVLRDEGVPPVKALPFIYDLCKRVQENNTLFVAHNGWNYDATMIYNHFKSFEVGEFNWREDDIFDTGAVVKLLQLPESEQPAPRLGESLRTYFKRVIAMRMPGVKWGLDGPAVAALNIGEFGVDPDRMHSAGNDSLAVHAVVERFREQLEILPAAGKRRKKSSTNATKTSRRRRGQRNR